MAVLNMDTQNVDTGKKRKLEAGTDPKSKQKKVKKSKLSLSNDVKSENKSIQAECEKTEDVEIQGQISTEEIAARYPVLNDTELVKKFLSVPMSNNQKGRIRQTLKQGLQGANNDLLPNIIYGKMQAIIKSSENLTEPELRKLRLLYNMLNQATKSGSSTESKDKKKKKNKKNKKAAKENDKSDSTDTKDDVNGTDNLSTDATEDKKRTDVKENVKKNKKEKKQDGADDKTSETKDKVKGPKRYVVFVGNLVPDIEKEKIMKHFSDIRDHIVDIRLPERKEGKKSSIAYIELKDEASYELALSKHHTMLDNKRINVLYTTQKNTKISKSEAKGTAAKLVALQKKGKLIGSVPLNKKRSFRRKKAKQAMAKAAAESGMN